MNQISTTLKAIEVQPGFSQTLFDKIFELQSLSLSAILCNLVCSWA